MRKIKNLLLLAAVFVLFPLEVFAAEKINVYLFRRDGCGYCEAALKFFNGLDAEYKSYFNLVEKEVSSSKDNSALMQKVAKSLNADVKGVPFIVIGTEHFEGYTSSWDENFKAAIKKAYENVDGTYKDVVASFIGDTEEDSNGAAITVIVLLVAAAGVAFLIYMAKEDTSNDEEEVVEEKKEEKNIKSSSSKKTNTSTKSKSVGTKKKTGSKKSTTNKK